MKEENKDALPALPRQLHPLKRMGVREFERTVRKMYVVRYDFHEALKMLRLEDLEDTPNQYQIYHKEIMARFKKAKEGDGSANSFIGFFLDRADVEASKTFPFFLKAIEKGYYNAANHIARILHRAGYIE